MTGWTGLRCTWLAAARAAGGGVRRWCSGIPDRLWHEAGSPNVPRCGIHRRRACESLSVIGFEAIGYHEHTLRERLDAGLAAIDGVRPLRIFSDSTGRVGIRETSPSTDYPRARWPVTQRPPRHRGA